MDVIPAPVRRTVCSDDLTAHVHLLNILDCEPLGSLAHINWSNFIRTDQRKRQIFRKNTLYSQNNGTASVVFARVGFWRPRPDQEYDSKYIYVAD